MILKTDRLTLRCAQDSDLDALFKVFSNAHAMRYWSTAPHADPSVTAERITRMRDRFQTHPTYFVFEHNGQVIGCGGLVPPHEVGFILHPDHHRHGFGREAMNAILAHVWDTTDLAQVIADADPQNGASIGLLTALGFHETHRAKDTFCINGQWSDSVYFALQRPS